MDATLLALLIVLAPPVAYAIWRTRGITRDAYLYNEGETSTAVTAGSVVCGNVGVGTFTAIYLFTHASPVVGLSIVATYTLGLFVCAAMAGRIHAAARRTGAYGLVDLIAQSHGVRHPLLVWAPVAVVFLMRAAVQLLALAIILQAGLGLDEGRALTLALIGGGLYVAIGGYRAASETDIAQAALILLGVLCLVLVAFDEAQGPDVARLLDLGPYTPVILVGIWLFLPFSALLSIDNWQRIATAESPAAARRGYLMAAPFCFAVYLAIAWMGMVGGATEDVPARLRAAMPDGFGFVVDAMFVAAIVSTIDTVMIPLTAPLLRRETSIARIRLAVVVAFGAVFAIAVVLGELLFAVIAVFTTLAVFLPVVVGALFRTRPSALAAVLALNFGVASALALTFVDIEIAGIAGFAISAAIYVAASRFWPGTEGSAADHSNR